MNPEYFNFSVLTCLGFVQDIQVGAATALAMLCRTAERAEPYLAGNANFSLGGKQVALYLLNMMVLSYCMY